MSLFRSLLGVNQEPDPFRLLVSVKTAVKIIGHSRATIYRRQQEVGFPKILKPGGKAVMRVADLQRYSASLHPSSGRLEE